MLSKAVTIASIAFTLIFVIIVPVFGAVDYHTEKSFPAIAGGKVKVDAAFGEIDVSVAAIDRVNIFVEMSAKGPFARKALNHCKPVFQNNNGEINLRIQGAPGFYGTWIKGRVRVQLPAGMNLDLHTGSGLCNIQGDFGQGKVKCDLSSGNLLIYGAMRELSVNMSSGSTIATFTREPVSVDLNSASGNIQLSNPGSLVKLRSASGNVELSGLTGSLTAELFSGNLISKWKIVNHDSQIRVNSSSGSVTLYLPPEIKLTGKASTASGGIVSDFPAIHQNRNELIFNGDGNSSKIDVKVASGSIGILKN